MSRVLETLTRIYGVRDTPKEWLFLEVSTIWGLLPWRFGGQPEFLRGAQRVGVAENSRWRSGWFSLGEGGGLGLVGWGSHKTWGSYSSLEEPTGRTYLNSLGSEGASFREWSQIGLRNSLGIISIFREVSEGAKHPDWNHLKGFGHRLSPS